MKNDEIKRLINERIAAHKHKHDLCMVRMKGYNDAGDLRAAEDMWHMAIEHQSVASELALIAEQIEEYHSDS